jgi:hypothetical protein
VGRRLICDICGRECEVIVAKLFLGPVIKGSAQAYHSNYTYHLDVGDCCYERLMKSFRWRKRMTQAQYHESRRNSGAKIK